MKTVIIKPTPISTLASLNKVVQELTLEARGIRAALAKRDANEWGEFWEFAGRDDRAGEKGGGK